MAELSIIIPAYNEVRRIGPTLEALAVHLSAEGPSATEILVVDDGSTDGTAARVLTLAESLPQLRVLRQEVNLGKGAAVRRGMLEARGRLRLMYDADGSMPPSEIPRLLAPLVAPPDGGRAAVALGSRYAEGSRVRLPQPAWRRLFSRAVNVVVRRGLVPGILDTHCGYKAFTAEAAELLFSNGRLDGWTFDLEILALASRLSLPMAEVGIVWDDDPGSRVAPARDALRVWREWTALRRAIKAHAYPCLAAAA